MTITEILIKYWWIAAIVLGFLVLITFISYLKKHKHNFKYVSSIVVRDYPRGVMLCKCGTLIHIPIYSIKKLKEIEK